MTGCQTLKDMTSKSYRCEIDLEHPGKRGLCQVRIVEGPGKRPMTSDHRVKGQQGLSQCSAYEKVHEGVCHSKGLGCYRVARLVMLAEGDRYSSRCCGYVILLDGHWEYVSLWNCERVWISRISIWSSASVWLSRTVYAILHAESDGFWS